MNDFKKNNRFGGGRSFGPKRDFGGRGGFGGPKDMYDAICASCGKTCQVPFRPNGKKPIYCKECFAENGGPSLDRGDRGDRRDFAPRREFSRPSFDRPATTSANSTNFDIADIKKQVQNLNSKIDSLIVLLGEKKQAPAASAPAATPAAPKANQIVVSAKALEKKPAKKAPTKKKAK